MKVREYREKHGLTQSQLAVLLGISQPMVAQVESGAVRMPAEWRTLLSKKGVEKMVTNILELGEILQRLEEATDKKMWRKLYLDELAALPEDSLVREQLRQYHRRYAPGPFEHWEYNILSPAHSSSVPRPPSRQQVEADARIEAARQAHRDAQQALYDAWRAAVEAKVARWGEVEMSDGRNAGQFAWRPEEQRKGLDAAYAEHFDRVAEAHAAIQSAERNIDEVRGANTRALRRGDGFKLPGIRRIIGGRE